MNREIVIRAKKKDSSEWLEVNLEDELESGFPSDFFQYELDILTVGQYTGLRDKHGVRIFEGDIVVKEGKYIWFLDDGTPNYVGLVEYYYSAFNVSVFSVNKGNRGFASGCGLNEEGLDEGDFSEWKIIGNKHDNPELLNEPNHSPS